MLTMYAITYKNGSELQTKAIEKLDKINQDDKNIYGIVKTEKIKERNLYKISVGTDEYPDNPLTFMPGLIIAAADNCTYNIGNRTLSDLMSDYKLKYNPTVKQCDRLINKINSAGGYACYLSLSEHSDIALHCYKKSDFDTGILGIAAVIDDSIIDKKKYLQECINEYEQYLNGYVYAVELLQYDYIGHEWIDIEYISNVYDVDDIVNDLCQIYKISADDLIKDGF